MKTTKSLLFAAVSVLSIGVGTAMAQSEVSASDADILYWKHKTMTVQPRLEAGSSDVTGVRSSTHNLPFNGDYGNLGNPG